MKRALREAKERRNESAIHLLELTVGDAMATGDLMYLGTVTRSLAVILQACGERSRAIAWLEQASTLIPEDGRILYELACLWEQSGNSGKARILLEKASDAALQSEDSLLMDLIREVGHRPDGPVK